MKYPAFHQYMQRISPGSDLPAIEPEEHSSDYEAGVTLVEGEHWRIRTARITPTKPGAFVAVWRRALDGSTEPFPADDSVTGLMALVLDVHHRGVFRFTAEHQAKLGITRSSTSAGKRGFRVYPSWCTDLNSQARRTQKAQAPAFELF